MQQDGETIGTFLTKFVEMISCIAPLDFCRFFTSVVNVMSVDIYSLAMIVFAIPVAL